MCNDIVTTEYLSITLLYVIVKLSNVGAISSKNVKLSLDATRIVQNI